MMCDRTGSMKSNMAASEYEVPESQFVGKKGTLSQRLYQLFRGPAIPWDIVRMMLDQTGRDKFKMATFELNSNKVILTS